MATPQRYRLVERHYDHDGNHIGGFQHGETGDEMACIKKMCGKINEYVTAGARRYCTCGVMTDTKRIDFDIKPVTPSAL